ncbi:MAG: sugar transferase [Bacillota bacterium]|nr:sugar transferase [Bacillota bacterium]
MYKKLLKRFFDIVLSAIALIIFSPVLVLLTIIGAIAMKGNPFFTQQRPGKNEKIFKLIKFRTMTNQKDKTGELLPDDIRLNKYGKFLRSTSLDELPELLNILFGQMSIVGPRPLLVQYLPLYNEHQKRRHIVRPGLTGFAQANGRNSISWEEKFDMDVWYVDNYSFMVDISIIFTTVKIVFKRSGISSDSNATMEEFVGAENEASFYDNVSQ